MVLPKSRPALTSSSNRGGEVVLGDVLCPAMAGGVATAWTVKEENNKKTKKSAQPDDIGGTRKQIRWRQLRARVTDFRRLGPNGELATAQRLQYAALGVGVAAQ